MAKNIKKIEILHKKQLSANEYFNGIKSGNRTILSKAITLIESANPKHQQIAEELIELCLPHSGKSIRIGITGVPGVGKSTFIEALGNYLTEDKDYKIAVLAIDPSSKKSGGSILFDIAQRRACTSEPSASCLFRQFSKCNTHEVELLPAEL